MDYDIFEKKAKSKVCYCWKKYTLLYTST